MNTNDETIEDSRERLVRRIASRREEMRPRPHYHVEQQADRRHVEMLETMRLLSDQLALLTDRLDPRRPAVTGADFDAYEAGDMARVWNKVARFYVPINGADMGLSAEDLERCWSEPGDVETNTFNAEPEGDGK